MKGTGLEVPLEVDAIFSLASCTKLMTTVAALQCIERGLITLDEDVTRVLPELKNVEIITGFDQRTQTPVFVRRKNRLTLRFVSRFLKVLLLLCPLIGDELYILYSAYC